MKKKPQYKKMQGKFIDEEVKEGTYPFVVIRYMPSVYDRRRIIFVENDGVKPDNPDTIVAVCSNPYKDGRLTVEGRKALIAAVRKLSQSSNFKLCLVFAKDECIYFDQGKTESSSESPSGGIACLRFPLK